MISNPSTSVINELFGKNRDAAAAVVASGQTSATPGTATTHALAPSVKAVLVVNAGTAAIAASVDDGTNWVAIAASGSLLVDVPLGRVQVKCDTAARVPYSISATTRAISQTVVPAAVAVLDALEAANTIYVGPGMKYTTIQSGLAAAASGDDVIVHPGSYSGDVAVPAGVNLIGTGTNCALEGNIVLGDGANVRGILLADGHYVQQNGVKYYV